MFGRAPRMQKAITTWPRFRFIACHRNMFLTYRSQRQTVLMRLRRRRRRLLASSVLVVLFAWGIITFGPVPRPEWWVAPTPARMRATITTWWSHARVARDYSRCMSFSAPVSHVVYEEGP